MTRVLSGPKGQLVVAALAHGLVTAGCAGPANVEALEQWTEAAAIPEPLQELHAAVLHGRIYIAGGFDADDAASTAAYRYDTAGDRWAPIRDLPRRRLRTSDRAPMPSRRGGLAAVALGGKIYTYGGETRTEVFDNHEVYDPAADAWTSLSSMPTGRHGLGAAAVGGKAWVIGGGPSAGFAQTDIVEVYNP